MGLLSGIANNLGRLGGGGNGGGGFLSNTLPLALQTYNYLENQDSARGVSENVTQGLDRANQYTQDTFNPNIQSGQQALGRRDALLADPSSVSQDPGYQFGLDQGTSAIERGAAARGGLFSGGTGIALNEYGQQYGQQFYDRALSRENTAIGQGLQAGQAAVPQVARLEQQRGEATASRELLQQQNRQETTRGLVDLATAGSNAPVNNIYGGGGYGAGGGYGNNGRNNGGGLLGGLLGGNNNNNNGRRNTGSNSNDSPVSRAIRGATGGNNNFTLGGIFEEVGDLFTEGPSGIGLGNLFGGGEGGFSFTGLFDSIADFDIAEGAADLFDFFSEGGGLDLAAGAGAKLAKDVIGEENAAAGELVGRGGAALNDQGNLVWDAVGGDATGLANLGAEATGVYAINRTFGNAFSQGGQEQAIGTQIGQTLGTFAAGPFGTIVGGMFGSIAGDLYSQLTGNRDKDDELKFSSATGGGGFENGTTFSTALGTFGYASEGTRNLTNPEVKAKLAQFEKVFAPFDEFMVGGLNDDELNSVRDLMDGFKVNNKNADKYGSNGVQAMMKLRLESVKKTLTPERMKESGFDKLIDNYNAQYTGLSAAQAQRINELAPRAKYSPTTTVEFRRAANKELGQILKDANVSRDVLTRVEERDEVESRVKRTVKAGDGRSGNLLV